MIIALSGEDVKQKSFKSSTTLCFPQPFFHDFRRVSSNLMLLQWHLVTSVALLSCQTREELSDESPILPRSYEDEVPLSDKIARGILPYGLAGELYLHEDPDASNYYLSKYVSLIRDLNRRAVQEPIRDVYHGIGHDQFGRW
jgi:hypothetical protein